MPEVAKFLVNDIFTLTGRGVVLSGQILEGNILIGNYIIADQDNKFQILGADYPRSQYTTLQLALFIGNVIQKADLNGTKNQILIITD